MELLAKYQKVLDDIGLNKFEVIGTHVDKNSHRWVTLKNVDFTTTITLSSIKNTKGKGLWFQYRLSEQGIREYCSEKFKDWHLIEGVEFMNLELKKRCSVRFTSVDGDTVVFTLKHLLERYSENLLFVSKKYMLESDFNARLKNIFFNKKLKLIKVNEAKKINERVVEFMCDKRLFSRKFVNCYVGMEKDIMNNYWTATSVESRLASEFIIDYVRIEKIYSKNSAVMCDLVNITNGDKVIGTLLNGVIQRGYSFSSKSQPEKIIKHILSEMNIDFIEQHKFEGLKHKLPLKFDFYLPSQNICIEFDGAQHKYSVAKWGGEEGFRIRKLRDSLKNTYCEENNIALFRIPYWKNTSSLLIPIIQDIVSSN